jgi:hypothetical protein
VYDEEVKAMIKRIDLMCDGVIDEDEFERFLELTEDIDDVLPDRVVITPMKTSQYLRRYLEIPTEFTQKRNISPNIKLELPSKFSTPIK